MIKHIVMWKLKDKKLAKEHGREMKIKLEGLSSLIKEVKELEVGIELNPTSDSFDVVLYSVFETMEDLKVYAVHPEHLKVVQFIKSVVSERVAVDYEI